MTVKYHKFVFPARVDESKIIHLWILDGQEVVKLTQYVTDKPNEWKCEWNLEFPEIDMLFDTEGLIKHVGDIKLIMKDMQSIILGTIVDEG